MNGANYVLLGEMLDASLSWMMLWGRGGLGRSMHRQGSLGIPGWQCRWEGRAGGKGAQVGGCELR